MPMQIEIQLDENCTQPRIIVVADRMSDALSDLILRLSTAVGSPQPFVLTGSRSNRPDTLEPLDPADFLRVFAASGKVYAATLRGEYVLRLRLYELEERLDRRAFVRISNSEIIHLKRAKSFDLSLAGTICVTLEDGSTAYVSRRYVPRIRQLLGL